jgi:methionyl-tRNA formyltransferase
VKEQVNNKFPERPKLIFMGTPDFAVPSLRALVDHGHEVLAVVTQPDRPRGRGRKMLPSSVKRAAMDYGLEIFQPEKISTPWFSEEIRSKEPDLIVVVAFGQILRKDFLNIPRWGVLNIHASLLPQYRGAAPIQWAILNNERKTGLTAMKMGEGLDSGPILLQEEVVILSDETSGQLHDRLAQMSGGFLLKTLKGLAEGALREIIQDSTKATYASKIDRNMSLIKWEHSAKTISALIRALDPWPGAFTRLGKKDIKLFSSRAISEKSIDEIPGRVIGYSEGALEVETGEGVVQIRELQAPGKKRLSAKDFLRGLPLDKNTILG